MYTVDVVLDDEFGEPLWDKSEIDQMIAAGVLVIIEPCEHGNYARHFTGEMSPVVGGNAYQIMPGTMMALSCPGPEKVNK